MSTFPFLFQVVLCQIKALLSERKHVSVKGHQFTEFDHSLLQRIPMQGAAKSIAKSFKTSISAEDITRVELVAEKIVHSPMDLLVDRQFYQMAKKCINFIASRMKLVDGNEEVSARRHSLVFSLLRKMTNSDIKQDLFITVGGWNIIKGISCQLSFPSDERIRILLNCLERMLHRWPELARSKMPAQTLFEILQDDSPFLQPQFLNQIDNNIFPALIRESSVVGSVCPISFCVPAMWALS